MRVQHIGILLATALMTGCSEPPPTGTAGTWKANTCALQLREVLLKGATFGETWPHLWPIGVFLVPMGALAPMRYRETLD